MSVRTRLALWYGVLLTLVLAAALTAAYFAHSEAHMAEVDTELDGIWASVVGHVDAAGLDAGSLARILPVLPGHDIGVAVVDARSLRTVASAGDLPPALADALPALPEGPQNVAVEGGRIRILVRAVDGAPGARLAVTMSLASIDAMLAGLRTLLLLVAASGISIALLGGWAIAGGALRPVAVLTRTARSIADSRAFSRRVPALRRRDELGELARTLNDMLASLDAAHQMQQRFVSDASHELRTPLTTVHGNAELLAQDDVDPAERREAVAQILRETQRLTRLIDDLLALARADAGSEPLEAARVQLDELVMEAFAELRPQAGQRLRVVALDEAPVSGERDRLKQLVLILLDNALRYTPADGTVEATVSAEGGTVVLRVDDTGIGVSPDVEAHAFDRFYRGEAARRLEPEGSGLGLSIARWIVERHGGSIRLLPHDPIGTRAVVRLPLAGTRVDDGSVRRGDGTTDTDDQPYATPRSAVTGPLGSR